MSGTAKAIAHIDNDRVIVTEYRLAPGANICWHRHARDYVIVPLLAGRLRLDTAEGSSVAEMKKGVPHFREAGVEHDVVNAGEGDYAFIEVELK